VDSNCTWIGHLMKSASTCSRMNERGMQAIIGVQKVISKDRDLTEWYRFKKDGKDL